MSETHSDWQTGTEKHGGEQVGSAAANSRTGSRSMQAGREFVKALAGDLAEIASRRRVSPIAKHRRMRPPRASAPRRVSSGPNGGGVFRFLSIALFGLASVSVLVLSGLMLWVLYGTPVEPRRSDADNLRLQFEARKGGSLGSGGPLRVGETSRRDMGGEPGAQRRPEAYVTIPSIASLGGSGSVSPDPGEQEKAGKETPIEAGPATDQPQSTGTNTQDRGPAAWQEETSKTVAEPRPRMQCSVSLCAATYKSFHAADCTYQPYGGGARRICALSTGSADARPQKSPVTTEANDRVAEGTERPPISAMPARAGAQCNVELCAAKYASFHAADCTYQPYGGGPRRICER